MDSIEPGVSSGGRFDPRWRSRKPPVGKADREVVHLIDDLSVDLEVSVGQEPTSTIIDVLDLRLDDHAMITREDLAAISPSVSLAQRRRFESRSGPGSPACRGQDLQ